MATKHVLRLTKTAFSSSTHLNRTPLTKGVRHTNLTNFRCFKSSSTGQSFHKGYGLGLVLGLGAVGLGLGLSQSISLEGQLGLNKVDPVKDIENPDPKIAFEGKSLADLITSLLVYKLCSFPILMDSAPTLLSLLETFYIATPAYFVIKHSIFKQFCGGEDREDVVPFMHQLKNKGVGSILDFSIEADLPDPNDRRTPEQIRQMANQHADFVCDQYNQAVVTASAMEGAFIAVKVTGLVNPQLLEKTTSILHFLRTKFIQNDNDRNGLLTRSEFESIVSELPNADKESVENAVQRADPKRTGKVDWISYLSSLSMVKKTSSNLFICSDDNKDIDTDMDKLTLTINFLSPAEKQDLELLVSRLESISSSAQKLGVRLMIDAEQSYFQAAIDLIANQLSQQYNTSHPIIFNTYQMYLKESYEKMRNDLIHAKRDGWCFGAKLVRGAYMVSERKRAFELGVPDIIQDSIEETHADYNRAVDLLLNELKADQQTPSAKPLTFMVASHNSHSIHRTCSEMQRLGLDPAANQVLFGQLMGMHDTTTLTLAKHQFNAFKYIPYGPVKEVMPYLIRRAQENSTVMQGVTKEQDELIAEIWRRFKGNQPAIDVEVA